MAEEREYLEILDDVGVDTTGLSVNRGRILRCKGGIEIPGLYFNRSRQGYIHFTLNHNARLEPDFTLWERLPYSVIKATDHDKPNIAPKPGMEGPALRQLLLPGRNRTLRT